MTKPKWVIFDVGGVLFDYMAARRDVAEYLSIDVQDIESKIIEFIGDFESLEPVAEGPMIRELLGDLNKLEHFDKVKELWWNKTRWIDDSIKLLREVHDAQYKVAIFTNNWLGNREIAQSMVEEMSLPHMWFESSIERLRKPHHDFYELVESRIGAKGEDIFFIDDTERNITTARERGWQTHHYQLEPDNGKGSNGNIRMKLYLS